MSILKTALKFIPGVSSFIDDFKNNTGAYEEKAINFLGTIDHPEGDTPVIVLVPVDGRLVALTGSINEDNVFTQGEIEINQKKCSLFKISDILTAMLKEYDL